MPEFIILPRPGATFESRPPIPGPSETDFTATFGALLPPAQYISTPAGRAAYYVFPPDATPASTQPSSVPSKVLLIHGVQTPALGLLPLITALRATHPSTTFATLDLWGHGLSDTPFLPHEGALFHSLIDAVLTQLGWKSQTGVGLVGYSFGAVLTMGYLSSSSFAAAAAVESCVLIAPAGLVRSAWFSERENAWLSAQCARAEEGEAAAFVVEALEGEALPIRVPGDWRDRVATGQVVAQAVKQWQMQNHAGHAASVVGVFRDGGVIDNDALFVRMKAGGILSLVVLGEKDGLSDMEEVKGFGFEVAVVEGAGHAVVRESADEVAGLICGFWGRG